jgi:hypothetical protein
VWIAKRPPIGLHATAVEIEDPRPATCVTELPLRDAPERVAAPDDVADTATDRL